MEDISLVEFKVDEYCPRTGNSGCCGGVSCAFQFNRDKADIRFQVEFPIWGVMYTDVIDRDVH